jgi:hypothetical protein
MKKGLYFIPSIALLGCADSLNIEQDAPVSAKEKRQGDFGSLLGEDGLSFGRKSEKNQAPGMNVNAILWRASLDTVHFMPISVSDPVGGVIATDWYSVPEAPNERTRINITITAQTLRADGLKINVFKQIRKGNEWISVNGNDKMAYDLETVILNRARQLKIQKTGK